MFLRRVVFLLCIFVVPVANAVTLGTMPAGGDVTVSLGPGLAPLTLIDLTNPASEAGTLNTATVKWSGGCEAAFRIKIFRQTTAGYQAMADRGPFDAIDGLNVVTLSPAISVTQGDLLAVVQLKPVNTCGGLSNGLFPYFGATRVAISSDPAVGTAAPGFIGGGITLGFRASTAPEVVEGYLTAVGSVRGAFGSNFKTSVQMTNLDDDTITGRFVFHRAGTAGSASDPSLSFAIPGNGTIAFDDLVAAMGQTGLGSIDVLTTNSYPPEITVRVFNDDGAGGTSGVTQEMRVPRLALGLFEQGILTVPSDVTNLRLNIGVRTLDQGATIIVRLVDSNGVHLATLSRSYPANYFEQSTAAEFVGRSVPANGVIHVIVNAGKAIVYGAVTDNKTNDPNLKWFTRF